MNMQSTQNMTTGQVVRRAIIIAIFSLIGWVVLCFILWVGLRTFGFEVDYWAMLEALSTAAAVAQFLGGGIVALRQMRDSVDSRNLSTFTEIFNRLMSDQEIEARRWIYTQLPDDPAAGMGNISREGQEHIKHVLNSFDHLGFLLEQDWITREAENAVIKWVSPMMVKVWAKLGPYVDYESRRRSEPDYYENVRFLAKRCQQWRAQFVPDSPVNWVKDAL